MRFRHIMTQNSDTTVWGGVSAILGLTLGQAPTDLERQFVVIVIFPMLGWLGVKLVSLLYNYIEGLVKDLWKNWRDKSNNQ